MRLTKIKLAGFKSFVDPVAFSVPGQLVAIIGPNGCGKSNIIDAVRWVMGESSVRQLRGESMEDVIFNGSATRKPVGQASIELVFDNSDGKLGGPWSSYREISIKRILSRGGQSTYHINGTRCRRRDITALFLGTGLGPRSYAIIEQGMISRVIDSKPDELRVLLEEAAGISKYKERRRETENRMRHTRENLDRLNDVREELDRQLNHLKRQAANAERFQTLKAQERELKAELLTLRWRAVDEQIDGLEKNLAELENQLQAQLAEQRALEAGLVAGREVQAELAEAVNQAQARQYSIGAEISRLEQTLEHRQQMRQQQQEERVRAEQALSDLLRQEQHDQTRLATLTEKLSLAEPALEQEQALAEQASGQLSAVESGLEDCRARWHTHQQNVSEAQRLADVERARIEQLDRSQLQSQQRIERLRQERDQQDDSALIAQLASLQDTEAKIAAELENEQKQLTAIERELTDTRLVAEQKRDANTSLQERIQSGRGRLSSLLTLQEAAFAASADEVQAWLTANGFSEAPRLARQITVEPGWERAVETVLTGFLDALCVAELDALASVAANLEKAGIALFQPPSDAVNDNALAAKISAPWPLDGLLNGVGIAAHIDDALARRAALRPGQSLITRDGVWVGRDWLKTARDQSDAGVLERQRQIDGLEAEIASDTAALELSNSAVEQQRETIRELEHTRARVQAQVNQHHREYARSHGQISALEQRLQQRALRAAQIDGDLCELEQELCDSSENLAQARARLERALAGMSELNNGEGVLLSEQQRLRGEYSKCREQAETARQAFQQALLHLQGLRDEQRAIEQALQRSSAQRDQLLQRREQLTVSVSDENEPQLHDRLAVLLDERVASDDALRHAQRNLQAKDAELRAFEQERVKLEQALNQMREHIERKRVARGESNVGRQTLANQLAELDTTPAAMVARLPEQANEEEHQAQLDALAARIQRLGAINLAAIDEYKILSQRKQYLDAQNDDLIAALATLQEAMSKMDRETRSRFKDMFDRVNQGIGQLYPRLFGGGKAYLDLVGDDTLDAGVAIMAQPPGKRVGTIHLLSGGEKALTAIALVFAIFQLNPAPFCMLDEVDAPLDENNVGRFGELLQELSEQVQFIIVTHNKATMEIAHQLTGVTMHEPGVSRLVAVDIDEAVRLAAV